MSDIPSFQELLAEAAYEVFVGREEQLALFEKALTTTRPPFLILAVSGQGGVGKTMLLEQFRHKAENHEVLTALVNEDQDTIETTLVRLAEQLRESGHPCKIFDEHYHKYRELKQQVEEDPKAPKGLLDFALRSATRIGFRSLKRVPIAAEAADVLLTPETEDVVTDQVSAMAAYVAQRFKNKDERVLLLETSQELSQHFVTDLNKLAEEHRLILFFDTYEKTALYLETWLWNLFNGKFGSFSSRILFVIAGRYPLGQAWMPFRRAIQQVELHEFSEAEARKYLESSGIMDEAQVSELLKLSDRLPVLLALLTSVPGDAPTEVCEDAVERFLQGATDEQREVALVASVTRFFNRDILAVLLDSEVVNAAFEWLTQTAFVRSGKAGWAYHDVVRSLMLRYLRLRSAKEWAETQGKLAEYYENLRDNLGLDEKKGRRDVTWQNFTLNVLYHRLCQAPQANLGMALHSFVSNFKALYFAFLEFYALTIYYAGIDVESNELKDWARLLFEGVIGYGERRYEPTIQMFTSLLREVDLGESERATVLDWRGHLCSLVGDTAKALEDLNKAIELTPNEAEYWVDRGITYQMMNLYDNAVADFSRAIELDPNAGTFHNRGMTYLKMELYENAIADLDKAIELDPENPTYLNNLGVPYWLNRRFNEIKVTYEKLVAIEPETASNAWVSLGLISYYYGDVEKAKYQFEQALATWNAAWERKGHTPAAHLQLMAVALFALGKVDDCFQTLNEAESHWKEGDVLDFASYELLSEAAIKLERLEEVFRFLRDMSHDLTSKLSEPPLEGHLPGTMPR